MDFVVSLQAFADEMIEFRRYDENEQDAKELLRTAGVVAATGAAAIGTYKHLRTRSPLANDAPEALKGLRVAAEKHGLAKVHIQDEPWTKAQKRLKSWLDPADKHRFVQVNKTFTVHQHKGPVFDPGDTGAVESKFKVGDERDKVARAINRSKLDEYHTASSMGVPMLKTEPLGHHSQLGENEIAKLNKGSMSKMVVTSQDIASHDPAHPVLKSYKRYRSSLKVKDPSERASKLTSHPGYKRALTEEAIKRPDKFVKQPKIDIADEYRVHTLGGKSIGIASGRYKFSNNTAEAERAAENALKTAHPDLTKNLLAMDMAKDKSGSWHVIETNPGAASGFLAPANKLDVRGPHKLYKQVTGRYSRESSILGGAAAGAVGAAGANYILPKVGQRRERPYG